MTPVEQIEAFEREFDALVLRFAHEYDMPVATMVGIITMKAHELMENNLEEE